MCAGTSIGNQVIEYYHFKKEIRYTSSELPINAALKNGSSTPGVPFSATASDLVLCGSGTCSWLTSFLETGAVLVSSERTASSALCGSNPHRMAAWVRTESGTASPSTVRMWSRQEYNLATVQNKHQEKKIVLGMEKMITDKKKTVSNVTLIKRVKIMTDSR